LPRFEVDSSKPDGGFGRFRMAPDNRFAFIEKRESEGEDGRVNLYIAGICAEKLPAVRRGERFRAKLFVLLMGVAIVR